MSGSASSSDATFFMVLGLRDDLRSARLAELIKNIDGCIFVAPPVVRSTDRNPELIDEVCSEVLLGRRMTNGEVGCAKGHKQILSQSHVEFHLRPNARWVVVAEDDADLDEISYRRIIDQLCGFHPKTPAVVTFVPERVLSRRTDWILNDETPKFNALTRWRKKTVCYALNREACETIARFAKLPIDYVADWPLYFAHLKFYASSHTWVVEAKTKSRIWDEPFLDPQEVRFVREFSASYLVNILRYLRGRKQLSSLSQRYELSMRVILAHLLVYPTIEKILAGLRVFVRRMRLHEQS